MCTLLSWNWEEILIYQHFKQNILICSISLINWYGVYLPCTTFIRIVGIIKKWACAMPTENMWIGYTLHYTTTLQEACQISQRLDRCSTNQLTTSLWYLMSVCSVNDVAQKHCLIECNVCDVLDLEQDQMCSHLYEPTNCGKVFLHPKDTFYLRRLMISRVAHQCECEQIVWQRHNCAHVLS